MNNINKDYKDYKDIDIIDKIKDVINETKEHPEIIRYKTFIGKNNLYKIYYLVEKDEKLILKNFLLSFNIIFKKRWNDFNIKEMNNFLIKILNIDKNDKEISLNYIDWINKIIIE